MSVRSACDACPRALAARDDPDVIGSAVETRSALDAARFEGDPGAKWPLLGVRRPADDVSPLCGEWGGEPGPPALAPAFVALPWDALPAR